jgi:hypothetical protein
MPFKIHPGIGIARVGNSVEFFIGPETLEIPPVPAGGYRDGAGKLRRQAARFRVFEYTASGELLGERTGQPGYSFEWTVHLRRRADLASTSDPILTNSQSIAGTSQALAFPEIAYPFPVGSACSFGELRTDPAGRLLVLSAVDFDTSGYGIEFDGLCDGTVEVFVTGPVGPPVAATAAWVFVGPPDYAPGRQPAKSLYDELYQAYVDHGLFSGLISPTPQPSFRRDIFPILRARHEGRPLDPAVESTFPLCGGVGGRQDAVDSKSGSPAYYEITSVQSQMLARWVGNPVTLPSGDFIDDWPPSAPLALSPEELDRGAIRHCLVCGSWEIGYQILSAAMFGAASPHVEPFRLAATEPLLLPTKNWISDVWACSWAPQTEKPGLTLEPWSTRGFMILDGDDLTYVEHVSAPYVLLLTPALAFGDVQTGPGGSTGFKSLPVSFEIHAEAAPASVSVTSIPSGLTYTSVPDVPAGALQTVHLWVTYNTSLVTPPLDGVIGVTAGGKAYAIPVSGNTVTFKNTQLALALDCSYSMTEPAGTGLTKMDVLKAALDVLITVVRQGDAMGFAPFSDDALSPAQPLLAITDAASRETLRAFVDDLPISNNTSIGDGLVAAHALLADPGTYENAAVIVVTDGKETAPDYISTVADQITSTTFALGIGTASNVAFGTLQTLTGNRGGAILLTGDPTVGDNRYALEKNLLQILHGATNDEIILDPLGTIAPGRVHELEIPITEAETSFEATVVSDDAALLKLGLKTPEGEIIDASTLSTLPGARVVTGSRVHSLALTLPLKTAGGAFAKAGTWRLLLASRLEPNEPNGPEASGQSSGKRLTYAALVSARSAIRFRARLTQDRGLFLLEAVVSAFGAAPPGAMRIVAEVRGPNQLRTEVLLKEREPGRYLAEYRPGSQGDYSVRLRAHGRSPAAYPFSRELSLVGASLGAEDIPWGVAPTHHRPCGAGPDRGRPAWCEMTGTWESLASLLEHCAAAVVRKKCRGKGRA